MPRPAIVSWKRGLATLAILLAGVASYIGATLPPRAIRLTAPIPPTIVFGGYHIHTRRSDGAQTVDEVAAAAARAGLRFVILTDHGNATRPPDPPAYSHGVLVIDAVEISTADGHVVALNLDKPSSYPLAGRGRDVIDDIHRLGGWAVVAHPDSPKKDLQWTAWDAQYDGVEWLNADSEWRDEPKGRLVATALRGIVRGPESVVSLFSRPDKTISRWSDDITRRPVVALGAIDAHGLFPFGDDFLRTVWQGVELEHALSGKADDDARQVLDAMHRARTFTIIPALAGPAALEFTATQSGVTVHAGEQFTSQAGPVSFHASVPGVPDAQLTLIWNDSTGPVQFTGRQDFAFGKGSLTYEGIPSPGAYHVEATLNAALYQPQSNKPFATVGPAPTYLPWLFSNSISVSERAASPANQPQPLLELEHVPASDGTWGIEHAVGSDGVVASDGEEHRLAFNLGTATAPSQFAALVVDIAGSARLRSIEFTARADKPIRLSVQVREPNPDRRDGLRWRRSVYLDMTPRTIVLPLSEFEPPFIGTTQIQDHTNQFRSLLFVVDTVNELPGAHGTIWISHVQLGHVKLE